MVQLYPLDNCFNFIAHFEKLSSTNDYIINLYKNSSFKNTLTVIAKNQTKGRGRMGKIWFSDSDKGLTFSFSLKLDSKINLFDINMLTSLSIVNLLRALNISASIKYPNDIVHNNKKISGLLIELIKVDSEPYCIVGVGLNINNSVFPKNLLDSTSVYQVTQSLFDVDEVFNLLMQILQKNMSLYLENKMSIKKSYFSALWGAQEYVPCLLKGQKVSVKILSITKNGFLSILIRDKGINTVNANDIKFLLY